MKNYLNIACIVLFLIVLFDLEWGFIMTEKSAPIEVSKYTVVIIEETEQRSGIPQSQLNAIKSQIWKDYVKGQGGQWRVLDPHADISKEDSWVKDSLSLSRESLPWLVFASPESGYSGPLPTTLEEFLEVIKK